MSACMVDGCEQPKPRGMGRRYCDEHAAEAADRRRRANVARVVRWRRDNPERHRLLVRTGPYGLTPAGFEDLLEHQDGCCAICGDRQYADLEIDHDHATGVVRGLLCGPCNRLLGLARDRDWVLEAAASYLASTPARQIKEARA